MIKMFEHINVKVFNLMPWVNQAKFYFNTNRASVNVSWMNACNSRQKRIHGLCSCKCKELDDWSFCENDCMWNPKTCYCECNKTCTVDE